MVLNSFNANANAIITPIIVSARMDTSPSVFRTEADSILKADRQLIMLDDHDSETLPFHYDKFVYLFHDVLSFYKTVIQAELQSNYSFPSLFSPCSALETCQWVQITLHFHLYFPLCLTKSKSYPLF